jgi:hypothetical protein
VATDKKGTGAITLTMTVAHTRGENDTALLDALGPSYYSGERHSPPARSVGTTPRGKVGAGASEPLDLTRQPLWE